MIDENPVSKNPIISMTVNSDRTVYPLGATVYIQAKLNAVIVGKSIIIEVYNSDKKLLITKEIDPNTFDDLDLKSAGIYQTSFVMKGREWKVDEKYIIKAIHSTAEAHDSFTIDLRHPVIQTDRSIYLPNSDIILTVIDPDADLDSQKIETIGNEPNRKISITTSKGKIVNYNLIETGPSTGIFQGTIKLIHTTQKGKKKNVVKHGTGPFDGSIPASIGDKITFTYFNRHETVTLYAYVSKFGATVELDQKVYTWTDKVVIAVVAPDHNFDSENIDTIRVTIKTKNHSLSSYILEETGPDTGIFVGSIILTGNPKIKGEEGVDGVGTNPTGKKGGLGPTDGILPCEDRDGLTVSFEYTEDETVVGSALIRWNIGEIQFLEANYPAPGQGVIHVVDPDMNLNPEKIDSFKINIWSDSDAVGTQLTVNETNESTGIFEGIILFTKTEKSSANMLRVADGDIVTAEYSDRTLPSPYTIKDELEISATTTIGALPPPLERVSVRNLMIVDENDNLLDEIKKDQLVRIKVNLTNNRALEQPFAYLVQITDEEETALPIMGSSGILKPKQSVEVFQNWIPKDPSVYKVKIFVWKSMDNPNALSPSISTIITVK